MLQNIEHVIGDEHIQNNRIQGYITIHLTSG